MLSKQISKYVLLGSLTATSFLAGSFYERKKISELQCIPRKICHMPALPIFGTVSAAKAFSPVPVETNVSRCSQIMRYGFPGLDNVRSFDDFVLSYDRRNRVAHWVFEHLIADNVKKNDAVDRSKCEFKPDESVHKFFRFVILIILIVTKINLYRSDSSDYKGSGYDRGHLAAAGNHKSSQTHIEQTFFLSNIAPQVGVGFNRDSWNRLEKYVRKLTRIYPNVYCCTGPLYLPR